MQTLTTMPNHEQAAVLVNTEIQISSYVFPGLNPQKEENKAGEINNSPKRNRRMIWDELESGGIFDR